MVQKIRKLKSEYREYNCSLSLFEKIFSRWLRRRWRPSPCSTWWRWRRPWRSPWWGSNEKVITSWWLTLQTDLLGWDVVSLCPHVDLLVVVYTRDDEEDPGTPGSALQESAQPEDDGPLVLLRNLPIWSLRQIEAIIVVAPDDRSWFSDEWRSRLIMYQVKSNIYYRLY